nr:reverse transcriptase domain, reverse transcriptase zinc-binding domain protein [Tanacetum cinerariifolium]
MAHTTGCASGMVPFTYLGWPIGSNMNLIMNWQPLIDRFHKKLSCRKANLLSISGRLTLIKAVLGSLGIYYLSIFKCPKSILKGLESLWASFFWGSRGDQKKMAWIKWENILASYEKGDLNIGSLKAFSIIVYFTWMLMLIAYFLIGFQMVFGHGIGLGKKLGSRNEEALENLLSEVVHVFLYNSPDSRQWSIANDGVFSVLDTRIHVDNVILLSRTPSERWSKILPRKRGCGIE